VRLAALVGALVLGLPLAAASGERPVGLEQMLEKAPALTVDAEPVTVTGEIGRALRLINTWQLTGSRRTFGGFSGLVLHDGMIYALSDGGFLLAAEYAVEGPRLSIGNARIAALRNSMGKRVKKRVDGDPEGLTWVAGRLAFSFESDPRVMFLGSDGRIREQVQPPGFARFPFNRGPEALATLPDDRLLVIAETGAGEDAPVFVIGPDGTAEERRLPLPGPQPVTDAEVGPDGKLYTVRRSYSLLFGVSIRITRFGLGADGFPVAATAENIAAFETAGGIDNMEGISFDRAADGTVRLWLISDDNNSWLQRTLLMVFDVTG